MNSSELSFGCFIKHANADTNYVVFGDKRISVDGVKYDTVCYVDIKNNKFYLRLEDDFKNFIKIEPIPWQYHEQLNNPLSVKFKLNGKWVKLKKFEI
ncbi:hypothetical protein [Photobacterium kishitanii]|uniref:Uncharacterized protein n=1 Tax=Photobacterium kishitanii TaxID=318456 RepID=A0A2T3KM33_9GAMM|nr:hypothetical protein [Photobacterium kishitanii]PSV00856.1 hypothetical protein C9J27_02185 [Photobacterium kishitanii]